jgi:CheY-like chemotaxis protein
VHEIKKAGGHLLELINEVLDLAKIESGRVSISIEPVLVAQIVDETLSLVRPMAEKYGIEIISNYTRCNRFVMTDRIRIKQVLINLISNAIKYNKENGKVTFYCEPYEDRIRFHVVDTGVGIPESELEEIFKPFNRLSATKNLVEGTGIGLTMVRQLMEMMNGSVHAESKVGEGSHFYIEIPETTVDELDPEALAIKAECMLQAEASRRAHKMLYVEDNPANLNLVERIISYVPGIDLLSASSAEVGIDMARAHRPELILLDINLPEMDGYQMFKRLRGYPETMNIPVVAISANAMEKDIKEALKAGFADYITKPVDVSVFIEKVKAFIKNDGD